MSENGTSKNTKYTLRPEGGEDQLFSAKPTAIRAGEKIGGSFQVISPSGKLVHEFTAPEEPKAKAKAKGKAKGKTKGKAEDLGSPIVGDDTPLVQMAVDYRGEGHPSHFWQASRDAALEFANALPLDGLVSVEAQGKTIVLSGTDADDLESAAEAVTMLWDDALAALKEHKKDKDASADIWAAIAEGRMAGRKAQGDFIKEFAAEYSVEGF